MNRDELIAHGRLTTGTVTKVKKLWWIKVKSAPVSATGEGRFPHKITYDFKVNYKTYTGTSPIPYNVDPPKIGQEVPVYYELGNPDNNVIGI